MHKAAAAECFLALFTTPHRACAIAGDLFEQPRASWLNILRTAGALFLRNVAAQPWRLSLLVLFGFFLRIATAQVYGIPIRVGWITRLPTAKPYWLVADSFVAPALIGYVIARLTREREITACLAYVIIHALFTLSASSAAWDAHFFRSTLIFGDVVPAIFLLTAGSLTRQRALARRLSPIR